MSKIPFVRGESWVSGSYAGFLQDPLGFLARSRETYGDIFYFRTYHKRFCVLADPSLIWEMFRLPASKLYRDSSIRVLLDNSMLVSNGEDWVRQRKSAQPYFRMERLNEDLPRMSELAALQLSRLRSDSPVKLDRFCTDYIYDLVIELIFKGESSQIELRLDELVLEMSEFVRKRSLGLIKCPMALPTSEHGKFYQTREVFLSYVDRLNERAESENKRNLLTFMKSDPKADRQELRTQALTFFLAGFETTAHAYFWTNYLLCKNPGYWERLRDEARSASLEGVHASEILSRLPLATACVNEALRLYPPGWYYQRRLLEDVSIGGRTVRKNSVLMASIYLVQRNPNIWESPSEFRPERFQTKIVDQSFIPFAGGKRYCIGKDLAMLELVLGLSRLALEGRFVMDESQVAEPSASVTFQPKGDVDARFVPWATSGARP